MFPALERFLTNIPRHGLNNAFGLAARRVERSTDALDQTDVAGATGDIHFLSPDGALIAKNSLEKSALAG